MRQGSKSRALTSSRSPEMSKLAHSNDETMAQIERDRRAEDGEPYDHSRHVECQVQCRVAEERNGALCRGDCDLLTATLTRLPPNAHMGRTVIDPSAAWPFPVIEP